MRILLTGATGFTGRHFDARATQCGHEVLPLQVDLTDQEAMFQTVEQLPKIDMVVHLAAVSHVRHANELDFYAVNTIGTTHLLAALTRLPESARPTKVLIASSANIYGNSQFSPIIESQVPKPVNHYAASKLAMEHIAFTYLDQLPIVVTRAFNYTGPGQATSFLIPKLVDHFDRRASMVELGNINVEREFNDIRWLVEVYLRLLTAGLPGETYNVCTGKTYSLSSIIEILTEITGHEIAVRVDSTLVRKHEVLRLCGDPQKLNLCIGELNRYDIVDSLRSMFSSSAP